MTFESIRETLGKPTFDVHRVHEQMTQAIQSLRRTIKQLRLAQVDEASMLAPGFVLGSRPVSGRPRRRSRNG